MTLKKELEALRKKSKTAVKRKADADARKAKTNENKRIAECETRAKINLKEILKTLRAKIKESPNNETYNVASDYSAPRGCYAYVSEVARLLQKEGLEATTEGQDNVDYYETRINWRHVKVKIS